MISHGGSFVGFRAEMIRFPEQKFSVICLANLSTIQSPTLARRVADIYLADQFKQPDTKYKAESVDATQFIERAPEKLNDYTGTFRNPVTGRIWKVFLEEGKLSVKTQGGSQFQIAPINQTQFRPVSSSVELTITFERQHSNKPSRMHVSREGEKTESYEAIQVVSPTSDQLAEYVGQFFSDEVQVTYKVVLEEGKLFIRHGNKHKNYPKEPLEPTLKDMFVVSFMGIHFLRHDPGKVSAFKLNVGRVKNIRFVKKD